MLRVFGDVPTSTHLFDVPLAATRADQLVASLHGVASRALNVLRHPLSALGVESLSDLALNGIMEVADAAADASGSIDMLSVLNRATALAFAGNDATKRATLETTPTMLRPTRAAPMLVALTRDGTLHAASVRAHEAARPVWRLHSSALISPPVLPARVASSSDVADDYVGTLYTLGALERVSVGDRAMLLAGSVHGTLLVDDNGVELAALRFRVGGERERCVLHVLRAAASARAPMQFARVCTDTIKCVS